MHPAIPENNMTLDQLFDNPYIAGASGVFDEGQLEKDKAALIGVPFVITKVVFHIPEKGKERDYVTCDIQVAPDRFIQEEVRRGRVPELMVEPEEKLKINDGSTGFRRQIVSMLDAWGLIQVGAIEKMADYDRPWTEWISFAETAEEKYRLGKHWPMEQADGETVFVPAVTKDRNGSPLRIVARHGLRVSHIAEYDTNVFYLG